MLSTFPPTECGIATFAAALSAGIIASGGSVDVVRIGDPPAIEDASVLASIAGDPGVGTRAALAVLNDAEVAIVQHEYGIFPGTDGRDVLELLNGLTVPSIVVAHTVLAEPTPGQRSVLERVCTAADSVVVMTETARDRLVRSYDVVAAKVRVIAHGAATPSVGEHLAAGTDSRGPKVLTWGLLGPGKGIEWAIDALALLHDLSPRPRYVIAGATHPKVLERSGETYRHMLQRRANASDARSMVSFDPAYRDLLSLNALIRTADLVVLPYDSADQVTSGVLVDAVAAGIPVVSTAFPHARELLASGAGIVVPQRDPVSLAEAIRTVLTEPGRAQRMRDEAQRLAPGLSWTAVAEQYTSLAEDLIVARRPVLT